MMKRFSLIVTAGRKQKNRKHHQQYLKWLRASTERNQILVSLSLDAGSGKDAVSDQNNDFEDVENDCFLRIYL